MPLVHIKLSVLIDTSAPVEEIGKLSLAYALAAGINQQGYRAIVRDNVPFKYRPHREITVIESIPAEEKNK